MVRHLLPDRWETGLPWRDSIYTLNAPGAAKGVEVAVFLSRFLEFVDDGAGRTPAVALAANIVNSASADYVLLISTPGNDAGGQRHLAFKTGGSPKNEVSASWAQYVGSVTTIEPYAF